MRAREQELVSLLQTGAADRRAALPSVPNERDAASRARVPAGAGQRFKSELIFSAQQVELFSTKSSREGEFEKLLKPPSQVATRAAREGVEVSWESPPDFSALRAALGGNPLLHLGYRVYRWRNGEEPRLVSASDGSQTTYRDRAVPLWRERLSYCVATVLEGTIGELPTLIESKRSSVITVETIENFSLEVLAGSEDRARVQLSAWIDGGWRKRVLEVAVGDRVRSPPNGTPGGEGSPAAPELDAGLTVQGLRWLEGQQDATVEHPEFLPDGRRRIDPSTGLPTFRTERAHVPTRTLELRCSEPSGAIRTFTSAALN